MNKPATMKKTLLFALLAVFAFLPALSQSTWKEEHALQERRDSIYKAITDAVERQQTAHVYELSHLYCSLCDTSVVSFDYSYALSMLAREAAHAGRLDEAISLAHRVVSMRRIDPACAEHHVATALSDEAIFYSNVGNYDEAVKCCKEAVEIYERTKYTDDEQAPVVMANLAVFLSQRGGEGDDELAISYGQQALKKFKKNSRGYINTLNNLAVCYAKIGNFTEADALSRTAFKSAKKVYGDDHRAYAIMLANHAARLADMRTYATAQTFAEEAEQGFAEAGDSTSLAYAHLLVNHAVICTAQEHYDESLKLLEKAQPLLAATVGTSHPQYIRCVSELAVVNNKKGNSERTEEYNRQLTNSLSTDSVVDLAKVRVLNKQAEIAAAGGNYDQAIQLGRTAHQAFFRAGHAAEAAEALTRVGVFYLAKQDYNAAILAGLSADSLLVKAPNSDILRADAANLVGMGYYYSDCYEQARHYAQTAIERYQAAADTLGSVYAKALSNLALYSYVSGDTVRAVSLAEEACRRQETVLGADHPDNAALYFNTARFYCGYNEALTEHYYHRAMKLQMQVVRNNFSHRTTAEREIFWNSKSYLFKAAPVLAYVYQKNDSLLADAYDAQLFTKGLLLNSEISFRNFLHETGDSLLLEKYERLELLRRDIDAAYSLPVAERAERIEKASTEAALLEKELVKGCKRFGNFMASFDGDCRSVAAALKDDEMAVELMEINVAGAGDTYVALYLRHGWQTPRCKVLFSERDLLDIGYDEARLNRSLSERTDINKLYADPAFGQAVWGKLLPELQGVHTVNFAPAGIFYSLGAEYLAIDSLTTMADRFNMHRLSSTRLLTERTTTPHHYKNASIFGGLTYDMTQQDILLAHDAFKNFQFEQPVDSFAEMALAAELAMLDSLSTRGGVGALPGTYVEAEGVGEALMQADVVTTMFLRDRGTEEAFKALNARDQDIIHIATHGFALTSSNANDIAFPLTAGISSDSHPLSRTGLLLAGANYTLNGGKLPTDVEDGVLTAREISILDLAGADLVVLSACRTAVGEIHDDGVFGLQRGFKKAGASTLLMSLWSVDDAATMTMMRSFYSALTAGQNKHDAFHTAQNALRAAGYASPYYWASFVMLDDL